MPAEDRPGKNCRYMYVGRTILEKYCGVRAPPGTTLARCIHFARNRFLDPNLVSYAKIEVAFGAFWTSLVDDPVGQKLFGRYFACPVAVAKPVD